MKILAVITGMKSGGAERVMATLCNELSKNNEVILLIFKNAETDYYIDNNVKIIPGCIKNKNLFKAISFLKSQIEKYQPDIILPFMTKSNIISLIAREKSAFKCPVIICERANPYYSSNLYKFLKKKIYPKSEGAVFQTKDAQEYYKDILKCESIVIRNPLSPDFKIKPYEGKREKKIVCTARLSSEKNQQLLIKTFAKIEDKYSDYKLEIYGEGPDKDKLQQLIDELNIGDKVKLMGRQKNIIECIKKAAIFVLPSNSEGMPNALLEAMALGIPSIATDCPIGGSAILIKNKENGLLIPMNDEDKMIEAIEKIINDKDFANKIGKNATKVVADFEPEKVCKEWEDYLIKVKENYHG